MLEIDDWLNYLFSSEPTIQLLAAFLTLKLLLKTPRMLLLAWEKVMLPNIDVFFYKSYYDITSYLSKLSLSGGEFGFMAKGFLFVSTTSLR